MKIDRQYFLNSNGSFYKWVADSFIYFALAELAGPSRIIFADETIEKYKFNNSPKNMTEKKNDAIISRTKKPFKELANIDSIPERVSPTIED